MQSYLWWRSYAISIWTCLCFGKFHVCTFNPCSSSSIWWTNEDSVCVCLGVVFIIGTCTRLHAHGAMREFSLNFDRMLERAIRHSPLHKKVSYIVPDKIHELYQVNVCEYASLVYWSIFQRPKQRLHYLCRVYRYTVVLCQNVCLVCCFWTAVKYGELYCWTNVFIV